MLVAPPIPHRHRRDRRRANDAAHRAGAAAHAEAADRRCADPLWPANRRDRPWVAGAKPQLPEPFTIERVVPMMDEAGVERVVIVPPTLEGERIDYAQEAVKRYPGRFAIMARIALDKPDRAARLATWREQPGVLGVRLNFGAQEAKWLTDGTADWFWPAAEKADLPVMFLTTGQLPLFASIAERHPKLQLIIDHMGVSSATVRKKRVPDTIAAGRRRSQSIRTYR